MNQHFSEASIHSVTKKKTHTSGCSCNALDAWLGGKLLFYSSTNLHCRK